MWHLAAGKSPVDGECTWRAQEIHAQAAPFPPDQLAQRLGLFGIICQNKSLGQFPAGYFQPRACVRHIMYQTGNACLVSVENDFAEVTGRFSAVPAFFRWRF